MIKRLIGKLKALRIYAVSGSCECGEHSKCVRKIHSNREGRLWVENEEHFKCGKVKKQVNDMLKWWDNYRWRQTQNHISINNYKNNHYDTK